VTTTGCQWPETADHLLSPARSAFPNDPAIAAVNAQLAGDQVDASTTAPLNRLPTDLAELRSRARAAEADRRITEPPDNNAVAYYRAILRQDGGDSEAQEALQRIGDDYAEAARQLIDRGNFDQASTAAVRGLEALPGDSRLIRLRDQAQGSRAP
jgi:hypothetical protein